MGMVLIFAATFAHGADVAKIGMVDFQKIFNTSNAGKKTQTSIADKYKSYEAELKARKEKIDEQGRNFERESLVMSAEMREEKGREFRIMVNDFRTLQKKRMTEFKPYEQQQINRIREDVLEIVGNIGKKEGYLLILEKRGGGVLYAPTALDLTDKVIQQYNAKHAAGGSATPKKN